MLRPVSCGIVAVSLLSCIPAHYSHPAVQGSRSIPYKLRSQVKKAARAQMDSASDARALADTALVRINEAIRRKSRQIDEANRELIGYVEFVRRESPKLDFYPPLLLLSPSLVYESVQIFQDDQSIDGAKESRNKLREAYKKYSIVHWQYSEEAKNSMDDERHSLIWMSTMVFSLTLGGVQPVLDLYKDYINLKNAYQISRETLR